MGCFLITSTGTPMRVAITIKIQSTAWTVQPSQSSPFTSRSVRSRQSTAQSSVDSSVNNSRLAVKRQTSRH